MSHAFQWKDEYSVNIKEIDDQHKQLVGLIFKLFTVINQNKAREELSGILDELIQYAGYHFSTEENYFQKFSYPDAAGHIEEHNKFKVKMIDLQKRYSEHEIEISFELIDFLEDWLLKHMSDEDKKYISCFAANGLK